VKTGIQIHIFLVSCFRRDGVWTPAFAGVTIKETFYEAIKSEGHEFKSIDAAGKGRYNST